MKVYPLYDSNKDTRGWDCKDAKNILEWTEQEEEAFKELEKVNPYQCTIIALQKLKIDIQNLILQLEQLQ